MRTRTPLTVLGDAVATNATTVGRRSAVIAVSGGLLVTMGMPAVAATSDAPQDPSTTTQSAVAGSSSVKASPKAQVSFALTSLTTVDAAQFQHDAQVTAGERAAVAERASRAADRFQAAKEAREASRVASTDSTADDPDVDQGPPEPSDDSSAAPAPSANTAGASVIDIAKRYTGIKYRFGGTTPAGFDCSGFVRYVYAQVGKDLPRTASQQATAGTRVSASEAKAGDIISFTGKGGIYHNGIYLGNGKMIDSPRSGKAIDVRDVWSSSVVFTRVA
ncbi:glycoside hydrolase [Streptomyces sp. NP160]|uniref:C40 family peptidase n=1 Tax=Streptomyces sp. NP160 TaxID=2586637 RepID=UPI0011185BF6|nr:C40 family peptidase [Streptomyces sp. NP160]TNM66964.1 glycoside hydrolase [Streptomyces sp. NP160]